MNTYDEIASAAKLLPIQERARLMSELAAPERHKGIIKAVKVVTGKRSDAHCVRFELEPADAAWLPFRQVAALIAAVGRARGLKPIRREGDPDVDAYRYRDADAERQGRMLEAAGIDPSEEFDEARLSSFLVGASVVVIETPTIEGIEVKLVLDQEAIASESSSST